MQCLQLSREFPNMDGITHILVSPLRRTLETCLVAFDPALTRGVQPIIWAALKEFGGGPCSKGAHKSKIKKQLSELGLSTNFSLLRHGWERLKESRPEEGARAKQVLEDLYELGEAIQQNTMWKGINVGVEQGKDAHVLGNQSWQSFGLGTWISM